MRGGCGSEVVLETVNASRAFLTIDSGFPLADLEQSLRTNRPFVLRLPAVARDGRRGPGVLARPPRRSSRANSSTLFLPTPRCAGCIWACPSPTRDRRGVAQGRPDGPSEGLRPRAGLLREHVRDPRGRGSGSGRSARARACGRNWSGASPDQGARFFERLLSRDDGWLASYFDALARLNGPVKDYLTEPERLKRLLPGDPGTRYQSWPRAPGVPVQHGHAAADHAPAPGIGWQAAHPGRPRRLEETVCGSPGGQLRCETEAPGAILEGARRRFGGSICACAARASRTSPSRSS